MFDVSIIIVSYNTRKLTIQCIESLIKNTSGLKFEIIIVDNASKDDFVRKLKKLGGEIKLIENSKNLGFSRANNQGIRIARGKYILLLNSDTVVKKNAVKELVDFAKSVQDAGVVGPKLINPDNRPQPSVFLFPTIKRAIFQYWLGKKHLLDKYLPKGIKPVGVESIVMAAFLIAPKALKDVGLLDERYFMYFEDIDYCRRVHQQNLKVYYLPIAEVIHYHGASGSNLATREEQWRRLIPSSKIYHGLFKHYLINFVIKSGQKWGKLKSRGIN